MPHQTPLIIRQTPDCLTAQVVTECPVMDPRWVGFWNNLRNLPPLRLSRWTWRDGVDVETLEHHQHTVSTMLICIQGVIRVVGRASCDLRAGDAIVIAAGCWHRHEPVRGEASFLQLGLLAGRCDASARQGRLKMWGWTIDDRLHRLLDGSDDETISVPSRLLQERLVAIDWVHPAVLPMAELVWNNIHRDVSVTDLLERSSLAPRQAGVVFSRFFGRGLGSELRSQRRRLAVRLLADGMEPNQVLRWCGLRNRLALRRLLDPA